MDHPNPRDTPETPDVPGYQVLGQLGEGGMGVVYKARHLGLNRLVALKVLRAGHNSPAQRRRFQAEAEALARLQHPNVVQVFDAGEVQGRPYSALEYVPGGGLDRRLRDAALPPAVSAELVAHLARATQAVHELGLVHRDLKPANILLTDGIPKIADFGLAKFLDDPDRSVTHPGDVLGTPSYMAPEQAAGRAAGATVAADVYGLGAILYECLAGRPPFQAPTAAETLALVRTRDPSPVRALRPEVPRDLEAVCLKCLRKESRHRYPSARALAGDLQRFLDGKPVEARPLPSVPRLWRWAGRRPLAVTAGLLAAAVVGLAAVAWWAVLRADAQEFLALLNGVGDLRSRRPPGWTWAAAEDLRRAASLPAARDHLPDLRAGLAEALASFDVREQHVLADDFVTGTLAFDPQGRHVALGQAYDDGGCAVRLYDPATGELRRTLPYPPLEGFAQQKGKADGTSALAFSPDGRCLVAGTRSGTLHRWKLDADRPEAVSWTGHTENVATLAFSHDGKALFSLSPKQGKLRRWDAAGGWGEAGSHDVNGAGLVVHPWGAWVGVDGGDNIAFLHPETLRPARDPIRSDAPPLALSPDGRVIAAPAGETLTLLDVESGEVVRHLRQAWRETAHNGVIAGAAFSPDGDLLLTWDTRSRRVRLWEVASGRLVSDWAALDAHHFDPRAAFHPDGRLAVSAGQATRLYEVGGREVVDRLAMHVWPVRAFAFTPDGGTLVTVEDGGRSRALTRWQLAGGKAELAGRHSIDPPTEHPVAPAVHPDGSLAAFADDDGVAGWVLRDGTRLAGFAAPEPARIVFDPDRRLWASRSAEVFCWDFPGGKAAKPWHTREVHPGSPFLAVESLAAGGPGVLAGSQEGHGWLLRLEGDEVRLASPGWTFPTETAVVAAAWNADETLAAFGNKSGEVYLVRPEGGKPLRLTAHGDAVTGVAFDRDGLMATGGRDGAVRLWRPAGGGFREEVALPHPGPVASVSFTPDGNGLAVLVEGEHAIRVWRLDRLRGKLAGAGLGPDRDSPLP